MRLLSSLLLPAVILSSCATVTTTSSTAKTDWLTELATQQIGQDATIEQNLNQSFALCWKDSTNPANNVPVLKFIIVRNSDHKVVEQGAVTMGAVKWTDDYEVEVSPAPGQVELERSPNSTTRKIDLKKYLDVIGR